MDKRYNVVQAKTSPNQDKTFWHKHGVAFEKDSKISIKLESLPIPNADGEIWLNLFEDDGKRQTPQSSAPAAAPADKIDDEIPF